ncbi:hypothetical protein JXA63_04705 [Candidatus Woesebacteria bacterium]|nr:hypothetical protein [Candidatus Woesebacteria bacterium]
MRAETEIRSGRILKKVEGSQYLFDKIGSEMEQYQVWLEDSGLRVPDTIVTFSDGIITFDQEYLGANHCESVISIVEILQGMSFDRFGMDSNPGNFMGDEQVYFVDFFPFLIRDNQVLSEQFDYPIETVLQRYFSATNVVSTFINRLFRENFEAAMVAVSKSADMLVSEFGEMLPREKDRLLMGIELAQAGGSGQDYISYYYTHKSAETITTDREEKLKIELKKIRDIVLSK